MIEQKRDNSRGDPEQEVKAWQKKLVEADRVRTGYQELTAKGLVTHEELAEKLTAFLETTDILFCCS